MSVNFIEIAQSVLQPVLIARAGDLFGMSQEQGKSALATILPTLMSGVLNKAAQKGGAASLFNAITDPAVDGNIVGKLSGLLESRDSASRLGEQGGKILGLLFGDKAAGLGEHIAGLTGTPAAGASHMLAVAAPALFGILKDHILSSRMTAQSFTSLLASQAAHLDKALPEKVLEWLGWGSLAGFIGGLGGKFTTAVKSLGGLFDFDSDGNVVPPGPVHDVDEKNDSGSWWKWLLALALITLAVLFFKSCHGPDAALPAGGQAAPATPATATGVSPADAPAVVAGVDSQLQLSFNNGKAVVNATVGSEAEKAELLKSLEAVYGKDGFSGDIKVDAAARPASWLPKLDELLKLSKVPGAELSIKGADVSLGGTLADPKLGLLDKLKSLFGGGMNVVNSLFSTEAAVKTAAEKFSDAIKALPVSGKCDADALAKAMNLYVINFPSGASEITVTDVAALKMAVPALENCSKGGAKIEIAGHTDNTGSAGTNLKVSEARANAVKQLLVSEGIPAAGITAKGYGDTQPVADNRTEEGRFQNRRITYALH
jgi:outer membrane protein OmpA-like peptidoglycan-associated protein